MILTDMGHTEELFPLKKKRREMNIIKGYSIANSGLNELVQSNGKNVRDSGLQIKEQKKCQDHLFRQERCMLKDSIESKY